MKPTKTSSASRLAKQLESVSLAEDGSAKPGVSGPRIVATSQQSRFHSATLELTSNLEVDLTTVNVSIGDREILVDAKVAFRAGVRYALTGRNGTGKSTLLQVLGDRIVPGLPPNLKIHLVTQVDPGPSSSRLSVLEYVLDLHTERKQALEEQDVLSRALESTDQRESHRLFNSLMVERAKKDLDEKRMIALRRSGARGKEARAEEIRAEEALAAAEERLKRGSVDADWAEKATELLAEVQLNLDLMEADGTPAQATRILRGLGFSSDMIAGRYDALSGGWRTRCRLAVALLVQVDLLMLDEPSNFCDLETTLWLEHHLINNPTYSTLVITSHDQVFLDRLAEQTACLRGQKLDYFDGTPSAMMAVEAEERRNKEKQIAALDKKREHVEASIAQGRKSAKANNDDARMRMVKSRQKKLDERWGLERSAKGGRFKLNRDLVGYHLTAREEITQREEEGGVKIKVLDPGPLKVKGSLAHLESVSLGYSGKGKTPGKVVLEGVNITIEQGGRVALIGANGKGKSTIAKAVVGELSPLKGSVTRHPSLKVGYFTQHAVEALTSVTGTPALTYFRETVSQLYSPIEEKEAWSSLGRLGLGGLAGVPIEALSGGQKVRLALALVLYPEPNMLVLDEVTTHLDAPTIRALARALKAYSGGIILITHDRWFSTVVVEGKPVDEGDDESSDEDEDDEAGIVGRRGVSYLVDKGKVKVLENGMEEYEKLVERRLARRRAKEGAGAP